MFMENEMNNNNNSQKFDANEDLIKKERFSDVEDDKNSKISSQESETGLFKEEQDNSGKEKGVAEKAKDTFEQAENREEAATEAAENLGKEAGDALQEAENTCREADTNSTELDSEEVSEGDYVEYVWNSDERNAQSTQVVNEIYYAAVQKEKKKSGLKVLFALFTCTLFLITLIVGTMLGYMIAKDNAKPQNNNNIFNNDQDPDDDDAQGDEDESEEVIEMIKNDGSVNVTVGSTGKSGLTKSEVVSLVADAVVEITTSTVQTYPGYGNYVTSGAGSGVVIAQSSEYAYIVTNYHVIDGASSASVIFTDGTKVDSEYLDGDENYDIAMLRIKTDKKVPKIVCGSSKSLKVGDDVLAIGNPLGQLGGTVTEGIISALDREVTIGGVKMTLLQTSAAVNPGNSGGGLFNMAGELIGIVNAKKSAEGIEGLGFAIPIDIIYDMLVEIIEDGYIHGRASLGITTEYISSVNEAISKYSLRATGIFVTGSSNDVIKAKDYIYAINGQQISDSSTYAAVMSSLKIGDKVSVTLYRVEGNTAPQKTVELTVVEYVPSGFLG